MIQLCKQLTYSELVPALQTLSHRVWQHRNQCVSRDAGAVGGSPHSWRSFLTTSKPCTASRVSGPTTHVTIFVKCDAGLPSCNRYVQLHSLQQPHHNI